MAEDSAGGINLGRELIKLLLAGLFASVLTLGASWLSMIERLTRLEERQVLTQATLDRVVQQLHQIRAEQERLATRNR